MSNSNAFNVWFAQAIAHGATTEQATLDATKYAQAHATANEAKNESFENVIKSALVKRSEACKALELDGQAKQLASPIRDCTDAVMVAAAKALPQTDLNAIAHSIAYCSATGKGIEQVKTVVKIATMIRAIASGCASLLDNNSVVGIRALLENQNHASVREMVVAQSKFARSGDTFNVRDTFKDIARYSVGTGNSQASQVRQVLNGFGFFDGFIKGGRNNDPSLNAYGQAVLSKLMTKA